MPDNNDGITINDITTPTENPSSLAVILDLPMAEFLFQPKNMYTTIIPFPAICRGEAFVLQNVAAFDGVQILSLEKLADAWPQESYERSQKSGSKFKCEGRGCHHRHPILAELTLKPTVEQAVLTDKLQKLSSSLDARQSKTYQGDIAKAESFPGERYGPSHQNHWSRNRSKRKP